MHQEKGFIYFLPFHLAWFKACIGTDIYSPFYIIFYIDSVTKAKSRVRKERVNEFAPNDHILAKYFPFLLVFNKKNFFVKFIIFKLYINSDA